MGLFTYAGDVYCPVCSAKEFEPCVYAWTQWNHRLDRVGEPILRNGYPYWHNERQYAQSNFNHTYLYGVNQIVLGNWLRNYGDILTRSADDIHREERSTDRGSLRSSIDGNENNDSGGLSNGSRQLDCAA